VQHVDLLDEGTRPVLMVSNPATKVDVSYLMFANDTGQRNSDSCRKAVMGPLLGEIHALGKVENDRTAEYTTTSGAVLAIRSYLLAAMEGTKLRQQNLFGFFGDAKTCFEVHVSKVQFEPGEEKLLEAELDRFRFDPEYVPGTPDYFQMGEIFFRARKNPGAASFYYKAALDSVPVESMEARLVVVRRVLTDQLVISYRMMGEMKKSQVVAVEGIARDPAYPMNYYNLARADAVQGHASDAKEHLQEAFARKANTLRGEEMPNPSRDPAFQKLKEDKEFWGVVQEFSPPMELRRR
jgi:hypothetical protein